jgi:predicted MFS family arabinose efflux permease
MRITAPAKLAVAWLTMFLVGTELFVFSPLLPVLAADYHIAPALAGLSVTMFSLAYMVSAPLFGCLADRVGRRRVLIYSLLAFALANILTAAAVNLSSLLIVRLFAGAAAAGVSPSIYALVGSAAPAERRATWLALVVSGLWFRLQSARRRAGWRAPSSAVRPYSLRSPASAWCWSG